MQRGSVVIVSAQGDYGKPRPAVIIQNSRLLNLVDSVTVCFLTTDISANGPLRVFVQPRPTNSLQLPSQIQVEKIMTFPRQKVKGPIGELTAAEMSLVDDGLLLFLDLFPPIAFSTIAPST